MAVLSLFGLALADGASDNPNNQSAKQLAPNGPAPKTQQPLKSQAVTEVTGDEQPLTAPHPSGPAVQVPPAPRPTVFAKSGSTGPVMKPMDAPVNDDCTGAIAIPVGAYPVVTAAEDVTEATPQGTNEGIASCAAIDHTVWYSFTPDLTAAYVISTCQGNGATGSTVYDTVLSLYASTAGSCPQSTELACNDTAAGCSTAGGGAPYWDQSTLSAVLQAGQTYYIVAGHWASDTGVGVSPGFNQIAVKVDISPAPPNDTCAAPTALTLNQVAYGSTAGAADDYQTPATAACFSGGIGSLNVPSTSPGRDVVYSFTAPADGTYSFRAFNDTSATGDAFRNQDAVVYVASDCPASGTPNCIKAADRKHPANAGSSQLQNRAEEVDCVPLTSGQTVYVYVDDETAGNDGFDFRLEAIRCSKETEPNDTTATASALFCTTEGSISPTTGDVDFFSLGVVPTNNKIFVMADAEAAYHNDLTMRITTTTDTLEFDNDDGASPIGSTAPVIAGTPGTGVATFARIRTNVGALTEPYHVYSIVEPPFDSAQTEVEPNDGFGTANGTATGYVKGEITSADAATGTGDVYRICVNKGDQIEVWADGDPTRDGTAFCPGPNIYDINGGILGTFGASACVSNLTPSPGTLAGVTPTIPGEGFMYRARYSGPYWLAVFSNSGSGDYAMAIAINCNPIPVRNVDPAVAMTGPSGVVNPTQQLTYTITITNPSGDIAQDVKLTDVLPPQLHFVSLSVTTEFGLSNVSCSSIPNLGESGPVVCTNYCMNPGATTTYTLTVEVAGCQGSGDFAHTVSIATLSNDTNLANDTSTINLHLDDNGVCSDGDACTTGDHCVGSVCTPTGPTNCDDHSVCTDDSCDPATGCIHDPSPGLGCNDGFDCTLDLCDPISGCFFPPAPAGTTCNDFLACTGPDACDGAGNCTGAPVNCDDGNPCTADSCDAATGACVHTPVAAGVACSDGNACTSGDSCDGAGTCVPGTPVVCDDGNACTADSCNPASGCVYAPTPDVACNDNNACTSNDTCNAAGQCVGTTVNCNDGNACTADSCDPASGCVNTPTPGASCSDGNACTTNDTCDAAGQCVGGAALVCNDGNACTADSCDPASGCVYTPTPGASCSDGNACTTNDTCNAAGQCVGGAALACDDHNPCTADSCDPASGCVNAPTPGASCTDGNACTVGDACNAAGQCVSGAPVVCGALDQCHDAGVCDPASGLCSNPAKPDGTVCNDNNLCTTGDHCEAGTCTYTFSGLNEPNPHSKGWYKGLCQNPHSGDSLSDADAVCVGQITSTFAGISTVAQICDVLMPSQPNNDACDKDEDELMTLALNICKARVCTAQDIDSKCGSNTNVGQSFSQSDGIFSNPSRSDATCDNGACMDREVNNGSALEMNSLTLSVESANVRLTWNPPYLNDGGGHPKSYNVYRRPAGSTVPFALIGNTAQPTFLDTQAGNDSWEYNVTEVMN